MNSLLELQASIVRALTGEDCAAFLTAGIHEGQFSAKQRLQIYRNNHITSLTCSLKHIYPVILRLVGENFFNVMVKDFIAKEQLSSGVLQEFGENFYQFIANYEPAKKLEYLSAVAHFEWCCHQAYYAADASSFNLEQLKAISPQDYGKIRFKLHPSHRLLEYHFPVLDIWQMCQQSEVDNPINLTTEKQKILIIRPEITVNMLILSPGEFALMAAFSQNLEFVKACTLALAAEPDFQVEACLKKNFTNKHIVGISIERYNI